MDKQYPKTLLITSSNFNLYSGTGILLKNLFRNWPKERLALIYYDSYNPRFNDKNICLHYYGLGTEGKRFIWPLSILGKKHHKKQTKSIQFTATGNRQLYNFLINILGGEEIIKRYTISPKIIQWIEHFKPEIIYCHISSLNHINFVKKIHSIFDIPVAIHIMDDWFNVRYKKGLFSPILRYLFFKEFKQLLSITSLRMGIGQKMCDHYEKEFNYYFVPFSNPVETNNWSRYKGKKTYNESFQIVYAGTINSKNLNGLKIFGEIVEELNSQGKIIKFRIYTFQPRLEYYRSTYEKPSSVIMGEVPDNDDDMAYILGTADLLYLPVDFTKSSIERMRYSIFAKIPAYMASGTPILFFGPLEITSVEYANKEKWAYVVDKNDRDTLKKGLIELMSNSNLRDMLSNNAYRIARRDFEARNVRESFRKALLKASDL
ncbi:MAG: glycosyltransferase [Bacteroidetes bacterium]|nr:glycosyltransferase [Bacteroidota bacterium]